MRTVLTASGAGAAYAKGAPLSIRDIDLVVEAGTALGIVGESGSGKTTLARMLVGALDPTVGTVTVNGKAWRDVDPGDAERSRVQYVFQDPYGSLNPWMTGVQAVAEIVRTTRRVSKWRSRSIAEELLASTGLTSEAMQRRPSSLSGGQRQRVGIARALATEPDIIIADEPTSALDVSVQAQILNLLLDLQRTRGLGLVLVSHDLGVVRHLTDEALVVYQGQVIERGATHDLLRNPTDDYTKLLVAASGS